MLSAYHEICKLLSFNEVTEYDKLLKREKDFAIPHTKSITLKDLKQ